jgi:hypothetical protein
MRRVAVIVSLATACTTAAATTTVTVELADAMPTSIAYRDGSAKWVVPDPLPGGSYAAHHYQLSVTDDYEIAVGVVSQANKSITAYELLATATDGSGWFLGSGGAFPLAAPGPVSAPTCVEPLTQPGPGYAVSGTMAQLGFVAIGDACVSNNGFTEPWSFDIGVLPGLADVIAGDNAGSAIAIWRALDVTAPITLPTLDVTTAGQPLAQREFAVTNTGASGDIEPLTSVLTLVTAAHTVASISDPAAEATSDLSMLSIIPDDLLEATDVETLAVTAVDDMGGTRTATTTAPGQVSALDLLSPPMIAEVTTTDAVTWIAPLDAWTQLVTSIMQGFAQGSGATLTVSATPRWLAGDATQDVLAFDLTAQGLDLPAQGLDQDSAIVLYLSTTAFVSQVLYTSTAPPTDTPVPP